MQHAGSAVAARAEPLRRATGAVTSTVAPRAALDPKRSYGEETDGTAGQGVGDNKLPNPIDVSVDNVPPRVGGRLKAFVRLRLAIIRRDIDGPTGWIGCLLPRAD